MSLARFRLRYAAMIGASGEDRTHDLPLTRRALYQLSYIGNLVGWQGLAPCDFRLRRALARGTLS
jgi:hypothetical protein